MQPIHRVHTFYLSPDMTLPTKPITGVHILGELVCGDAMKLLEADQLLEEVRSSLSANNLNVIGEIKHIFPGSGFTLLFGLAESHLSLHTWPELNYVTLDVFVCNISKDSTLAAHSVFESIVKIFKPLSVTMREIKR